MTWADDAYSKVVVVVFADIKDDFEEGVCINLVLVTT